MKEKSNQISNSEIVNHEFPNLKQYAEFLIGNHLDNFIKYTLEFAYEEDFPVLRLLRSYSEKEVYQIFRAGLEEQTLLPIVQGTPFEEINLKIEDWKSNSAVIPRDALDTADITAIYNIRKYVFLDFLKFYDCTREELILLTKEIDQFFDKCIDMGLKAYEEIHKTKSAFENADIPGPAVVRQQATTEQFFNFIEGVRDYAIYMINPDGTVASWNEGAKKLKGYSVDEIIGKHFSIFYPQDKRDEKFPEYELEQAGKVGRFEDEGWRIRKDGTAFWANVVITAIYDKEKNLVGFTKITRDLSERKQFEESLTKMNIQLEEKVKERTEELTRTVNNLTKINNDLDNFIYTASHDLKAPISNIEGLLNGLYEELGEQAKKDPAIKAFREMLDASITRFQSTIKELTEIAKIQKGNLENVEEVNIQELLEDIKFSIRDQIVKSDAEIISDLGQCSNIRFVKKNLKSIIYNLISNGIKYRSPERKPIIRLTCSQDKDNYILSCRDNGLGIREENIGKMFTMFKRFHDHVEGSGIGLYIVKRIIENSGGSIEVKSREEEGSEFIITIPKRSPVAVSEDELEQTNK